MARKVRKKVRNWGQLTPNEPIQLEERPVFSDELNVAKVGVVGSNPIARSNKIKQIKPILQRYEKAGARNGRVMGSACVLVGIRPL